MKAHINDKLAAELEELKQPWESWNDVINRLYREAGYAEAPEAEA